MGGIKRGSIVVAEPGRQAWTSVRLLRQTCGSGCLMRVGIFDYAALWVRRLRDYGKESKGCGLIEDSRCDGCGDVDAA